MHKILLGIAVLGVAATVGAVVAIKNNENLRSKADEAAGKAKHAADKAISKAKEAADGLAKTVKDLGKGSSVDAEGNDTDNVEDAPEHEDADCFSLDDLISPEAKEYASRLKAAFSSAEKAFTTAMKTSEEGTTESKNEVAVPESDVSEFSPANDVDLDAIDDVPDETDEAQIAASEPEEPADTADISDEVDEVPGFTSSDDKDTD